MPCAIILPTPKHGIRYYMMLVTLHVDTTRCPDCILQDAPIRERQREAGWMKVVGRAIKPGRAINIPQSKFLYSVLIITDVY
jgi:hypothetical protein